MSFLTYDVTKMGIFDVLCHEILDPNPEIQDTAVLASQITFVDGIEGRLRCRDLLG